ncbi:uncharacterized protein A4U43_C05F10520 [Asparagus officinalis]|uniref:Uncharacterized protein n=1 Tax=Asparagus officinalis TaxID=4686 RepID=A0A5P1EQR1_ASPOF|nr:uncharacterized protein A4U43_C05F10520 [Asparagus officinalis]
MEKKQTPTPTTFHPLGICEKIFNVIRPALQPLRRLTYHYQEATAVPSSSSPPPQPTEKAQLPEAQQINSKPKAEEVKKPGKTKSQKIDDHRTTTPGKIRTGSGVGRVQSSKIK